ncbi:MAG: FecR domain-containing protein [Candidatus Riflebacteria bacterium]|nr:FecR domain-containing protein [Candidatus Riflebacteria bacterium]
MSNSCLKPERIQEYLENSLSPAEMAAVAAHINSCPGCQQQLRSFENVFKMATVTAKETLHQKLPRESLAALMTKIQQQKQTGSKSQENIANKPVRAFSISDILRLLLIPAVGLILLAAGIKSAKMARPQQKNTIQKQFSLSLNSAEVLLGNVPSIINGQVITGKEIALPADAVVLVQVDKHKLRFSEAARFSFGDHEVTLNSGQASFDLHGDHAGLKIVTPAVTVTPLGTSFEVESRSWGTRLTLKSGSVEALSNSGIKRRLNTPGTIYVSAAGAFSETMPQPEQLEPAHYEPPKPVPASPDTGNAPGKLIDSF